jgi:hypothetical protein
VGYLTLNIGNIAIHAIVISLRSSTLSSSSVLHL